MNSHLILYGTLGCHLCDIAESIVLPLASQYQLQISIVDIADDAQLESRYALHIPVLSYDNRELNWPFDHSTTDQFLARIVRGQQK